MINYLANQIIESKQKFDGVYGVPRGGLIIAVCLSHKLNLPMLLQPTKKSLIVDDISDTGHTVNHLPKKRLATLFTTNWTKSPPDWFCDIKEKKEDWIVFPYEK